MYVKQLRLRERLQAHSGEFVIWEGGLGAAANPITVLQSARDLSGRIRIISFDHTVAPLQFALQHAENLQYLRGYEPHLQRLLVEGGVRFNHDQLNVTWDLHVADFPSFITKPIMQQLSKPHVIMFDAFSPATNPEMWTLSLFEHLFALLDRHRPCASAH